MTLPAKQAYSTVPAGGVISQDLVVFWMSCGPTLMVSLGNGGVQNNPDPNVQFTYFQAAKLDLG